MNHRTEVLRDILRSAFLRSGKSATQIAERIDVKPKAVQSILDGLPMTDRDIEAVAAAAGLFYAQDLTPEDDQDE